MSKPLILVTNDDGIFANGIKALVEVCKYFGEVVIVAPDSPQSGQGHAITLNSPLRLSQVNDFGIEAYECSGTPVDCVKLAKNVVLNNRVPDLCVSGINHGSNASINIIYSGTMSAAMEASLEGIPSIGFSYLDFDANADFSACKKIAHTLIEKMLANPPKDKLLLNVNIPRLPYEDIKGIKVCRQSKGNWTEEFIKAEDPRGQAYYWMTGEFYTEETATDTDIWALKNGYVSVVPSHHDLTDYNQLDKLKEVI